MFPLILLPDWVTLLVTMVAMYVGTVVGGFELAPPVEVHDHVPPHCGGDEVVELA
jgi:hypothetical protein